MPSSINVTGEDLFEELLDGHVLLGVLLHDLCDGHFEVLLRDVHTTLTEGVHARLGAHALHLSAYRGRRGLVRGKGERTQE